MDKTGFKLDRESFCTGVTVLDTSVEQSVEKDFVLPDYCADIFRILKCIIEPTVVSQTINGGKLSFEMCVTARVLYCSESGGNVNCIVQKMNYTKSVDLADNCLDPSVCITPRCDYVNCRVISPRRLDIRGAVTARVRVSCEEKRSLITGASGCCIQLRKQLMTYPSTRLTANKRVTVIEELGLAADKPPVDQVIRTQCSIDPGEQKIIAGKLVTKGDASISMLYSCVNVAGEETLETMKFSIPFSQIIDIEGIDESFEANVKITPAGCEIIPSADKHSSLECELVMLVSCEALKYQTGEVVTDAYSTGFECDIKTAPGSFGSTPVNIRQDKVVTAAVNYPDDEIVQVYDSWAAADNAGASFDDESGSWSVSANVRFSVLAKSKGDIPIFLETEAPFEQAIELPEELARHRELTIEPVVSVNSCEFRMTDGNNIEVTASLAVDTTAYSDSAKQIVTDITVDTDKPKQQEKDCAVKLCYCSEQDDIWDIAKRYSTSVDAIMEENELSGEGTPRGMLLIPLMK